jgi:hypothetical protein
VALDAIQEARGLANICHHAEDSESRPWLQTSGQIAAVHGDELAGNVGGIG